MEKKRAQKGLSMSEKNGYTIMPGEDTMIVLDAAPNAVCTIRLENEPAKHELVVIANSAGKVMFNIYPSGKTKTVATFTISFLKDGVAVTIPFLITVNKKESAAFPFFNGENLMPKLKGKKRKALTSEQIKTWSNADLVNKGYPPRPDKKQANDSWKIWKEVVSQDSVIIDPVQIPSPDIQAGPLIQNISTNWCGFEPQNRSGDRAFCQATGSWQVPYTSNSTGNIDYSAIWVGIDGGVPDLVQAGTEQNSIPFQFEGIMLFLTVCYAWTEFLPVQLRQMILTDCPVYQFDNVYVSVYITQDRIIPDPNGTCCVFIIENYTRQWSTVVRNCIDATSGITNFACNSVEWIVERPFIFPGGRRTTPALAKFRTLRIFGTSGYDGISGTYFGNKGGDRCVQFTMQEGTRVLALAKSVTDSQIKVSWRAAT